MPGKKVTQSLLQAIPDCERNPIPQFLEGYVWQAFPLFPGFFSFLFFPAFPLPRLSLNAPLFFPLLQLTRLRLYRRQVELDLFPPQEILGDLHLLR